MSHRSLAQTATSQCIGQAAERAGCCFWGGSRGILGPEGLQSRAPPTARAHTLLLLQVRPLLFTSGARTRARTTVPAFNSNEDGVPTAGLRLKKARPQGDAANACQGTLVRWARQAKFPPIFPQFSPRSSQGGTLSAVQLFGHLAGVTMGTQRRRGLCSHRDFPTSTVWRHVLVRDFLTWPSTMGFGH